MKDICYRGPELQRSLDLVRELNAEVIKVNADEWIIRGVLQGEVPNQALDLMNKERAWTLSQLDTESIDYLKSLPSELEIKLEGLRILAYHATPHSLFDIVPPDEPKKNLIKSQMVQESDIYVYAHINKPYIRYTNGKCIINTGSVGLPFDGQKNAAYAIVEINGNNYQTAINKEVFSDEYLNAIKYEEVRYLYSLGEQMYKKAKPKRLIMDYLSFLF